MSHNPQTKTDCAQPVARSLSFFLLFLATRNLTNHINEEALNNKS
jgi:hypothetical protein